MTDEIKAHRQRLWLFGALVFATFYSLLALQAAFRLPLLVSDDARQHVFWMERFRDPSLFPGDIIADYFQAVAPAGYKLIYWSLAKLGIAPLLVSKIVPALLGILIAYLAFHLFLEIIPDSRGAFFASLFFCQLIWLKDDVVSGTPRAFLYPLLLLFLLLTLRRRMAALFVLALESLIYPQVALLSVAIAFLRLIHWDRGRPRLSRQQPDYVLAIGALIVVVAATLPFVGSSSKYGPIIWRHEAQSVPEFGSHGRAQFFGGFQFWVGGSRAGLIPLPLSLPMSLLAMAAPICFLARTPFGLPLEQRKRAEILAQTLCAGIGMWILAHLFLFKLHLPARYSGMAFHTVVPLAAAITLSWLWNLAIGGRKRNLERAASISPLIALSFVSLLLLIYPHLTPKFARRSYSEARPAKLYDFLRTQPKSTVIATMDRCGAFIPTFAQRSVLTGAEYAIPYHQGYYRIIRQRGRDLVRAITTSRPDVLGAFITDNHVNLFVLNRTPLTPATFKKQVWFSDIVKVSELEWPDRAPLIYSLADSAKVWANETLVVIDAQSLLQKIRSSEIPASP